MAVTFNQLIFFKKGKKASKKPKSGYQGISKCPAVSGPFARWWMVTFVLTVQAFACVSGMSKTRVVFPF